MIKTVLVANRGEIARRVFRSCRALGLGTVAVYSDPDAAEPHVAEADAAVRLPGSAAKDTYLRIDLLIDAARRSGADAVHPGYGFLSENAGFARAVLAAGLIWIGPPPDAIAAMGSKTGAKKLMAAAGVPVLPELAAGRVTDEDLPVLVKAAGGGGGRGMRIVRSREDTPAAIESAAAEAKAAFGDETAFCEPYIQGGHHIEVQILADDHGTAWMVGERECSIQRRHQKVIEEAPSPLVQRMPGMRARIEQAAAAATEAVGYRNAGTVEFLADESGRFWFLEMNTRLQVEHPVTEAVTGLDLVAWQLKIAAGQPLPDARPQAKGHAIEARLYAEDPAAGWQPQAGRVHELAIDPAVRVDAGVAAGSVVTTHYDPMLAKVIAWADDRQQAAAMLARALATARIHCPATNRDLLVRVLRHPDFLVGQTDTGFFETHALTAPLADDSARYLSALAAALADAAGRRRQSRQQGGPVLAGLPSGWRNVPSQPQVVLYDGIEVRYRLDRGALVTDGGQPAELVSMRPDRVELEIAGVWRAFEVARYEERVYVDSALGPVTLVPLPRFPDPAVRVAAGSLLAPMPGTVVRVAVSAGDQVEAGQPLLWLEAMKMEHCICAPPGGGVLTELPVQAGEQVAAGQLLAVIRAEGDGLHRDR
ncbi:MAG TPA: biotin carboxylase N-terminal domain-containing protein [Streptosporangiaceae bacterium]